MGGGVSVFLYFVLTNAIESVIIVGNKYRQFINELKCKWYFGVVTCSYNFVKEKLNLLKISNSLDFFNDFRQLFHKTEETKIAE